MADPNVLTMVARLQDETPAQFRAMQANMLNAARSPGFRDFRNRFQDMNAMVGPFTNTIKDSLLPALGVLGIRSLTVAGAISGMFLGYARLAQGAISLKTLSEQTRVSTERLKQWRIAAQLVGSTADQMDKDFSHWQEIMLQWTGGLEGEAVGNAKELRNLLYDMGPATTKLRDKMDEFAKANKGDTEGGLITFIDGMKELVKEPGFQALILRGAGLSTAYTADIVAKMRAVGAQTSLNTEQSEKFNKEWITFLTTAQDLGKVIFNVIGPGLTWVLDSWQKVLTAIPLGWRAVIDAIVAATPDWFKRFWGWQTPALGSGEMPAPTPGIGTRRTGIGRFRRPGQPAAPQVPGAGEDVPGAPAPRTQAPIPRGSRGPIPPGAQPAIPPNATPAVPTPEGAAPPREPGGFTPRAPGQQGAVEGTGGLRGSGFLAAQRESFTQEVANNPAVRQQVAAIASLEHETDPVAVVESLANRQAYINAERAKQGLPPRSVSEMLHGSGGKSFYGPIRKGLLPGRVAELQSNPQRLAKMNAAIDEVSAGSNVLKGRTDQGSPGDPNAYGPGLIKRQGEHYTDFGGGPGGHAAATRFREEQQRRVLGESGGTDTVNAGPAARGIGNVIEAQSGIRKGALSGQTRGYLEYASAMTGLGVVVGSGGQPAVGRRGIDRTGSHRHDFGGAGDVRVFEMVNGQRRFLNMSNPEDQKRMADFMSHSVSAGATGVGAGMGYMGAETMHIGGGTRATWGGAPWVAGAAARGRSMPMQKIPTPGLDKALINESGTQSVEGTAKIKVDVGAGNGNGNGKKDRDVFKSTPESKAQTMGIAEEASEGPGKESESFGAW